MGLWGNTTGGLGGRNGAGIGVGTGKAMGAAQKRGAQGALRTSGAHPGRLIHVLLHGLLQQSGLLHFLFFLCFA